VQKSNSSRCTIFLQLRTSVQLEQNEGYDAYLLHISFNVIIDGRTSSLDHGRPEQALIPSNTTTTSNLINYYCRLHHDVCLSISTTSGSAFSFSIASSCHCTRESKCDDSGGLFVVFVSTRNCAPSGSYGSRRLSFALAAYLHCPRRFTPGIPLGKPRWNILLDAEFESAFASILWIVLVSEDFVVVVIPGICWCFNFALAAALILDQITNAFILIASCYV